MKIMIKLYDTLTRAVKEFKPLSQSEVKLYSCGPTVYDYQHIGNFRKFVFDDTLRRTLESLGYNVVHVMNITDVGHLVSDADEGEDKLEKGARREGKTVWEVAQHYTNAFKKDAKKLNILDPNGYRGEKDNYARATDFI
jgi:cysteinyl-tRNA synthetase